jgi:translocation and assembly module TamA
MLFPLYAFCQVCYEVEFIGVPTAEVECALRRAASLVLDEQDPPPSITGLIQRAESDLPILVRVLHSFGYYSAEVRFRLDRKTDPVKVIITVYAGALYPLTSFSIHPAEDDPRIYDYAKIDPSSLGVTLYGPALAEPILCARERLISEMECEGFPLARIVDFEVAVDATHHTVEVLLVVDSGPLCTFGRTATYGVCKVSQRAINKALAWRVGQPYSPCVIAETCRRLRDMGLFNYVAITHADETCPDGTLPMRICVIERKQRTIWLGGSYNTRELFGVEASWFHRNMRRMGDKLTLEAEWNERKWGGSAFYRDIQFGHPDQDLILFFEAKDDRTNPGFDEDSILLSATIERRYSCHFQYSYGAAIQQLKITDSPSAGEYTVGSLPVTLSWDNSNDVLDPTQGTTAYLLLEPAADGSHHFHSWLKAHLIATGYLPLNRSRKFVLAGWTSIGSIVGTSFGQIPPPYRFYAGTDTSLRGYRYKSVGPLDAANQPLGGRSIMLYGIEGRVRVTKCFGLVTFFEFGNVFVSELPSFSQKLLKSWGFGVRYFTLVGPVSLDIAFPLDRRPGIDKPFQVYLTVGQAF